MSSARTISSRACAARASRCRVLLTGSAHVYRQSIAAIDEDSPIGPGSPYGVSKLAQEMLALASTATAR